MNGKKLLAILLVAVMCLSNAAMIFTSFADETATNGTVVAKGSEWEYLVYDDTQAAAPEGWATKEDSETWEIGAAPFNGGGTGMPYGLFRSYIRQEFTLSSDIATATLYIKYDEQPVVYINGIEVWDWTDYDAGKNYYDHMYVTVSLTDYVSAFKTGTNVIAVDWRNEVGGSVMDLQLDVVAAGEKVDADGNVIVASTESYNGAGNPASNPFGEAIGGVQNLYDGDDGSVWGWGEAGIHVIANFNGEVNVKSIYLETKNEGKLAGDAAASHGNYKIEAMVNGEWIVVDETVSAFIEGNYVSTDVTTNRIKVTITDWYNDNWWSIAELRFSTNECESTEPDVVVPEVTPTPTPTPDDSTVTLNVYPAFGGWENWANSPNKGEYVAVTQLLVGATDADGNVVAELYGDIQYTITFTWDVDGTVNTKTITLAPATYNSDYNLLRFETALGDGDNQFVPVKGEGYTVEITATIGEKTYTGKSADYAFVCPMGAIVPGTYGFEAEHTKATGYNYYSFGDFNAPAQMFDGDLGTVWGSAFDAENNQYVIVEYGALCTFDSLYLACKNEGVPEGEVAEEFVFGKYVVEALVDGEWKYVATVDARINGVTIEDNFDASAIKVTIDEWYGGAWACIAEFDAKGKKTQLTAYDADGYNYYGFGAINAPTNIFDGDLNTVWGSGFDAENNQNIVIKYAYDFQVNKIYLACKNEGVPEGAVAEEFVFGTYRIEAYDKATDSWTVLAEDVPALINGTTVDVDAVTTMIRVTITSWNGGAWACVAEYAAYGTDAPKNVTVEPWGDGWENWSDQTQLLITAPIAPNGTVEYLTWVITIGDKEVTLVPSSWYDFGNGTCIWRFETCLAEGDNQFIPEAGATYTVAFKIYDGDTLVYIGTAAEGATWNVPADFQPIVPGTEEPEPTPEPEFGFKVEEDGTRYYYEDGTFAKGWQTIDGKTYRFDGQGLLFEGESLVYGSQTFWFDADHAVLEGLVLDADGYRFYIGGVRQYAWQDTDGDGEKDSYFYVSSYLRCEVDRMLFDGVASRRFYVYDAETGFMVKAQGFYTNENGTQYFINGIGKYGWITPEGEIINDRPGVEVSGAYYFAYGDGINYYRVEDASKTIGGVTRVFDEDHLVTAYTGWVLSRVTGNPNYYVEGVMQQGWCLTPDGWVYLSRSEKREENISYGDVFYEWRKIGGKVYYFRASTSNPAYTLITDAERALNYQGSRDVYIINQPADPTTATGADYYITNPPAGF